MKRGKRGRTISFDWFNAWSDRWPFVSSANDQFRMMAFRPAQGKYFLLLLIRGGRVEAKPKDNDS